MKPFEVRICAYSLAPGGVGNNRVTVYSSRHKSPRAASRKLAEIINRKTPFARDVLRQCMRVGDAPFYQIIDATGQSRALNAFRVAHGL